MKSVAPELPIVCPLLGEAAVPGLVASFARPAGSVTGLANFVEGLVVKCFELALDIVPNADVIGLLLNPTGASTALFASQLEAAARSRSVTLVEARAKNDDELAGAFATFAKERPQAVVAVANQFLSSRNARITQLAMAARLPIIFSDSRDVEAGALASYGVDRSVNFRAAAGYVAKIIKGTKPGDLPIEFPTKLVLAINLKTASALGITIPARSSDAPTR
jgi:putative ABC transport system substrate-binding protein